MEDDTMVNRIPGTRFLVTLGAALAIVPAWTAPPRAQAEGGGATIVRLDPRLDALLAKDATVEKLADGYSWVEGPLWDSRAGMLLFSDTIENVIHKWKDGEGAGDFLRPSGYTGSAPFTGKEPGSNGLTFDAQHRLVMCQHGDRRIARRDGDHFTTLADRYDGKRFNSPNDLVYRSNGDLYFTDPAYGLPKTFDDPQRELPFTGVYKLSADGAVTLLVKDLKAPNGVAFSPDEKLLYVAQSAGDAPIVMAYPVNADGTTGAGNVFRDFAADAKAGKPGAPDGLKVDVHGNVWTTGPGGVWVLAPDATPLGHIDTGVPTSNVAWGDDGSTLYITANHALLRVKTKTKGKIPGN
jgi:gluconolactonase